MTTQKTQRVPEIRLWDSEHFVLEIEVAFAHHAGCPRFNSHFKGKRKKKSSPRTTIDKITIRKRMWSSEWFPPATDEDRYRDT